MNGAAPAPAPRAAGLDSELLLARSAEESLALIAQGANPNARNLHGVSVLSLAAIHGRAGQLAALLQHCDAMSLDLSGSTALILAAYAGHSECVRLLLPRSDPGAPDRSGARALEAAASNGDTACVELLLPVSDPSWRDAQGRGALELALLWNRPQAAALIEGWSARLEASQIQASLGAAAPPALAKGHPRSL